MEQKWYTKLLWWICELFNHPGSSNNSWVYNGYYHRDCKFCKRIISTKFNPKPWFKSANYVTCKENNLDNGLTLIQINPLAAVDLQKRSEYFGYLFLNTEGEWYPEYKLSDIEIDYAYELSSDMKVYDCGGNSE